MRCRSRSSKNFFTISFLEQPPFTTNTAKNLLYHKKSKHQNAAALSTHVMSVVIWQNILLPSDTTKCPSTETCHSHATNVITWQTCLQVFAITLELNINIFCVFVFCECICEYIVCDDRDDCSASPIQQSAPRPSSSYKPSFVSCFDLIEIFLLLILKYSN